ncbi:MAG: type II toxin-antitoxin system HicB family antitoxin [Dehalococcoidia bacterium]
MTVPKAQVKGYVLITFIVSEEEGGYVSTCPELGIASQGNTVDEAIEGIKDATLVYLSTIEQLGERERVFKERGIKVQRQPPTQATTLQLRPSEFGSPFVVPIQSWPRIHGRTAVPA